MLSYKATPRGVPRQERERERERERRTQRAGERCGGRVEIETHTESGREVWGEGGDSDEMGVAGGFVCSRV